MQHHNIHKLNPDGIQNLSARQGNKLTRHKKNGAQICIDKTGKTIVVLDQHGKFITA
jgi:hypothetical protein